MAKRTRREQAQRRARAAARQRVAPSESSGVPAEDHPRPRVEPVAAPAGRATPSGGSALGILAGVGLVLGAVLGAVLGNAVLGGGVGLAVGLALGLLLDRRTRGR